MKRLINTKLFFMSEKMSGAFHPGEQDTRAVYEDFVHKVAWLCTLAEADVQAYFTLHYTRLELERLQILLNNEGAGEKCPNPKLHRPLSCFY